MPAQPNLRGGIGVMPAGMRMSSLNDDMGKWLQGNHSVVQLMAIHKLSALMC